jgi:tRNA 5-methylaminomethyl-2-thiouridine biosynthesis bifunctional protein
MSSSYSNAAIVPANIVWRGESPYSRDFDDVYFSAPDGLAESRAVFIAHNNLPQRWANGDKADSFRIVELGFGTGLNFLATWQAYAQAKQQLPLHFISVEKHPLRQADLQRALRAWPELEAFSRLLLADYPPLVAGWHDMHWGTLQLSLYFGDVVAMLDDVEKAVDAWFLDGFAPAKNAAMWTEKLHRRMVVLSRPGTTFSTFSAAGAVRRSLQAAGFQVEKVPGFGAKRDMLRGAVA